ncbi:2,5-diamino-6-(ribosylamino)-4(3H)-pyrimidinone 5'-phosphate reductase [Candidatus Hecatella orcuttiae]|uniref:2,5-diamino-6-(ribosylamino)-4(3H)-pyrimidinone 5'-phosphate reductase n=1 Tax=Candidatus Hecatella orcuttiae TaxID=1935119 RepID=UPI002867D764|nr:2,5-diamino-6-(ribosylamino)-4(3H)-pyrimidinone 5'-phosphate reductase [Candidatus Hecatella orcuttiae]
MKPPAQRPYVILNAAMSLDGKIASRRGDSALSSPEDWRRVHRLRRRVDAIMIGINTLLVDDPKLTVKGPRAVGVPLKIVVDSRARTPPDAKILTHTHKGGVLIAVGGRAPETRVKALRKAGAQVLRAGETEKVNLKLLLKKLGKMGVKTVLLEGGGTLNWGMVKAGLVDEVQVAIAPYLVGGREAVSLVEGEGFPTIRESFKLRFSGMEKAGEDIVLKFRKTR